MKKNVFKLLLIFMSILLLVGCGKEEKEIEGKVGGWELNTSVTNTINSKEEDIFKKAVEEYTGAELEPIAYLGSQVVAGTNHMYLCKSTTTTEKPIISFKVVIVYENLQNEVELVRIEDFDLNKYVNVDIENSNEVLSGGWTVSSEGGGNSLTEDEREMFNNATKELLGVNYKPLVVLATQVVAGKNYAVLSVAETVIENPVYNISVVTIYKDLEDNSKVLAVANVNLADYNA